MFTTQRAIATAAGISTLLVLGIGTLPATARQDSGPMIERGATDPRFCALERVGTQFVKCDDLTGNGVVAPAWVPRAG
jgi:hypothetical protein